MPLTLRDIPRVFKLTPKQREATRLCAGPQRHTLLKGGARSGKTFKIVRILVIRALKASRSRHAIFRLTGVSCHQSVYLDTFHSVMSKCFPNVPWKYVGKDGYVLFPNGSELWFAGLDDKERVEKVLGKEFATLYFNECSQISYATVLLVLTRLAQKVEGLRNRAFYDLNPLSTTHWTERLFEQHVDPLTKQPVKDPRNYASMCMNPIDNLDNIDPEFLAQLEAMPERFRRRFMLGLPASDLDNALWTMDILEQRRVPARPEEAFDRIVVAVDPSGAAGPEDKRSDEIGLSVVGRLRGAGYVLHDGTMKGKPEAWGKAAAKLYADYGADAIVGETNFGGDMVRATIHAVDQNIRFIKVTATRGKVVRAEPVSALYEQGKMFHVGMFPKLEDELLNFTSDGYKGDRSPNRADALVWAAHELLLTNQNTGLLEFYRMDHERRTARKSA